MKVKELISICTSATCYSVWGGGHADERGEYYGSFGLPEEVISKFGSREVKSIYPASKDVISIAIKYLDEE